ncbi:hypothetical protein [Streptomyces sp. NPDC087317]|uniref:hypothetical protein n=1 Tax=Streptomyces sp. NPDC087317 TaxID=3365784 RepID=UPI0037F15D4B
MNTRAVNAAAGVIAAAMEQGKTIPAMLAIALDSARLLQSPETAAELAGFRKLELGDVDGRVSAACGKAEHPTWLRATDDTRGCPWCRVAELEAEEYVAPSPSCTRCYGADAARFVAEGGATPTCRVCGPSEVTELRARVAELEELLVAKDRPVDEDPIAYALTDKAQALEVDATQQVRKLAVHLKEDVTPQVRRLRALLAGQREQVQGGGV